jgi:MATE family multidrug resistance protein
MDIIEETPSAGLAQVLQMSWPASLTMLNSTIMKFVDGFMVSRVGPVPFAAQYVAGMSSFVPESFFMGVLTVVNTYVSQNFGAGRFRRTGQYAWAGIAVAVLAAAAMAPLALGAGPMFRFFGSLSRSGQVSADLVRLETVYFRYMILAVGMALSSRVLEQFFYGVHRPRIVLTASLIANAFNVGANAVLIFGLLGFPAMGLEGAAIGTVLAWGLQLAILLGAFLSGPIHRLCATRAVAGVRVRQCLDLVRLGWPAGVQLCNDIASWAVFTIALVGFFGEAHLAANTAVMRYVGLSFMPAVGIGIAATALVGRQIGHGRPELARRRTHVALAIAMTYMGACGLAFLLFRYPMVSFFVRVAPGGSSAAGTGQIVRIGAALMLCAAVVQLFDAVGIVYVGALRGAGDTFWPMRVTVVLSWGMIVGGGLLAIRLVPQLESTGVWIAASAYVIVRGLVMAWRFESGAWRRIDLLNRTAGRAESERTGA